jgi:hypothetical protein
MMTNIVKAIVSLSYFSFDIMLFLSVDSGTDDNVDKDDRDGNQDDNKDDDENFPRIIAWVILDGVSLKVIMGSWTRKIVPIHTRQKFNVSGGPFYQRN